MEDGKLTRLQFKAVSQSIIMDDNVDRSASEALAKLASEIIMQVKAGIASNAIRPEEEVFRKWKVTNFKYDDNGLGNVSRTYDAFKKKTWYWGGLAMRHQILKTPLYFDTASYLSNLYGKDSKLQLQGFVESVIDESLEQDIDESKLADLSSRVMKGLKGEPIRCGAQVQLQGIVLHPERVEISHGVILRKTTMQDLEFEQLYTSLASVSRSDLVIDISAILNIEFLGTRANEIQRRVEQAVAILRLFKVGSVKFVTYSMFTDSLTDPISQGTMYSGETTSALDRYLITDDDVAKLKNYWDNVLDFIPWSFYWPEEGREIYTTIAYKLYSDALLQNGHRKKNSERDHGSRRTFSQSKWRSARIVISSRQKSSKSNGQFWI